MASQKKDTWKFKKWFTVYAPKVFGDSIVIGEMPANGDKDVSNRNINISLNTLTNNPSHMYTTAVLRVDEVNGDNVTTKLVRLRLPYSYLRSIVRRYRSISNVRISGITKDGIKVVAKVLVVTKERTTNSKVVGMRKELSEYLNEEIPKNTYEELLKAIMEGRIQSELNSKMTHITPINKVEFTAFEVN
jgi:small subunit ribosomal protein S3Ae